MSIFISVPVEDLERSKAFYTALGWPLNEALSSEAGACFTLDEHTSIMVLSREGYASVGGTEDLIGGPGTPSPVTVSFTLSSRDAVDALTEQAGAAGGRIGDTDDYGFMYQRQFDDPDGYHYSPFWSNPEAPQG